MIKKDPHDRTGLAIAVITLTVFFLSFGDALIKQTSTNLTLWQIFVLRSVLVLPVLYAIVRVFFSSVSLIPNTLRWTVCRSIMLVLMWISYYAALPHLHLSVAAAVYYTLPLFITIFSALFTGEAVRPAGWGALALGFCGIALILKPVPSEFNPYAVLPMFAAMLYAAAMILTRTKCRNEHPLVLSGTLNIAFVVAGLVPITWELFISDTNQLPPFLSGVWPSLTGNEIKVITILAVTVLIGSIGTAIAYQSGPSSTVATFDFSYVGFATIWGFAFFGEVPDGMTLTGMAMIVAAGAIAIQQERVSQRTATAEA